MERNQKDIYREEKLVREKRRLIKEKREVLHHLDNSIKEAEEGAKLFASILVMLYQLKNDIIGIKEE